MEDFCDCTDYKTLKSNNKDLFKWHPSYGWVLSWIEITNERGYTQIHGYGIVANFCPMCGKKVNNAK